MPYPHEEARSFAGKNAAHIYAEIEFADICVLGKIELVEINPEDIGEMVDSP